MQLEGLDDLYQEIILDHYRNPRNSEVLEGPDLLSKGFNPFCGDEVILTASINQIGFIEFTGLKTQGCAISQASASIMGELIKGKSLKEASGLSDLFRGVMQGQELTGDQAESLGEMAVLRGVKQFPVRIKCALLPWSTLDDAITDFSSKG